MSAQRIGLGWCLCACALGAGLSSCTSRPLREGQEHFQTRRYEQAIDSLQAGIARHQKRFVLNPKRIFASGDAVEVAQIYLRMARVKAAEQACRRGTNLFRQGTLMDAGHEFSRAAELDSTNLLATKMQGQVERQKASAKKLASQAQTLVQQARYDDALAQLEQAHDWARTFPHIEALRAQALEGSFQQHLALGNRALKRGDFDQAVTEFSLALRRKPQHDIALASRTQAVRRRQAKGLCKQAAEHAEAGRLEAALQTYAQALAIAQAFPPALAGQQRASAKLAETRSAEAVRALASKSAAQLHAALDGLAQAERWAPGRDDVRAARQAVESALAQRLLDRGKELLDAQPWARAATAHRLLADACSLTPTLADAQAARDVAAELAQLKRTTWLCIQADDADAKALAQRLFAQLQATARPNVRVTLDPAERVAEQIRARLATLHPDALRDAELDILTLQVQVESAGKASLTRSAPSRVASEHLAGANAVVNPDWDPTAARLAEESRQLVETQQRYVGLRADRETAALAVARAQTADRAAALAFSLQLSLQRDLLRDGSDFKSRGLPTAAAAAKSAAAQALEPISVLKRQATSKRDELSRATRALSQANSALARYGADARRREAVVVQLQRYLDTEPRERMVDIRKPYVFQSSKEKLTSEVHYQAAIMVAQARVVARPAARVANSFERVRTTGAHRLDIQGKANEAVPFRTATGFLGELRDAATMELTQQIVAFAVQRHRRFLVSAEELTEDRPDAAAESYLCFVAADRGDDQAGCRIAETYVEAHAPLPRALPQLDTRKDTHAP